MDERDIPLIMALTLSGIDIVTEQELRLKGEIFLDSLVYCKIYWEIDCNHHINLRKFIELSEVFSIKYSESYALIKCKDSSNFYFYRNEEKSRLKAQTIYKSLYGE